MRSNAFSIREYRPDDLQEVLQLNAYGLEAAGIAVGEDYYGAEDFADPVTYTEAARGVLLVGEIDGRIVAMGGIRQMDAETCELLRMRVYPEFQGRGYATAVLVRLEAEAVRLGYKQIQLLTGEEQHPEVDLYAKHGFVVARREVLLGILSVHMIKKLFV